MQPGSWSQLADCLLHLCWRCCCSYKWDTLPAGQRPERGLLGLRAGLNAFANLRPAIVPPQVRWQQQHSNSLQSALVLLARYLVLGKQQQRKQQH